MRWCWWVKFISHGSSRKIDLETLVKLALNVLKGIEVDRSIVRTYFRAIFWILDYPIPYALLHHIIANSRLDRTATARVYSTNMIMNQHRIALLVFLTLESLPCFSIVNAFITPLQHPHRLPPRTISSSPSRLSAGFGGGGKSSKKKGKKNNKEAKLKPKQMWDRYLELKKDTKVRVAVRRNSEEEWLEVGAVKSKGDKNTAAAVFRQRALIAEVSFFSSSSSSSMLCNIYVCG